MKLRMAQYDGPKPGMSTCKLRRLVYDVGKDIYVRTVTFILEPDSYGRMSWSIHVEAANQRDESQTIRGLTAETILAMAEAVAVAKFNHGGEASV